MHRSHGTKRILSEHYTIFKHSEMVCGPDFLLSSFILLLDKTNQIEDLIFNLTITITFNNFIKMNKGNGKSISRENRNLS